MAQGPGLSLDIDRLAFGSDRPVFTDLRLEVPPAQVLALLGPSGVGKTTLLRILSGAERRYEGEVRIAGKPPTEAPTPGYVFQDARLLPWLTVEDNLKAVTPELDPARIDRLLAEVGLSGHARSWPHTLSGGMQRRLAVARALSVHRGLLLLDEPFVSLDRSMVRDLQALFLRVIANGEPTVVIVSHDPEDAARLSERAVVLAGRPARITADVTLPGRPGERSAADIARLTAELTEASAFAGAAI